MSVRKHRNDWMLDVAIKGQRIREYGFKTRTLAKARECELKKSGGAISKSMSLVEFVTIWQDLHGHTLRDPYRFPRTYAIAKSIGGTVAHFDAMSFIKYRSERLKSVSVSTINHETRYLRAVFSEMIRLGQYHSENPMSGVKTLRETKKELEYLELFQVEYLLDALRTSRNTHAVIVAEICLSTGARWCEAQSLQRSDLIVSGPVYYLRFRDTKNGSTRYVQITSEFHNKILNSANSGERLFDSCRDAFRSTVKRLGIELPTGQLTHILRHTFASHFIMSGRDILTLSRILGHSDIKVTMRYAHLSPDHLSEVLQFNPIALLGLQNGDLTATV